MRRLLLVLSMIVTLAPFVTAKGQIDETAPIQNGCRPEVIEVIEPIAEELDYAEACRAYEECAREHILEVVTTCDLYAVDSLLSSCLPEDATCHANALLHGATIPVFGILWTSSSSRGVELFLGDVSEALDAFQSQDYVTALAIYERLVEALPNRVVLLSRAIVEEQRSQLSNALEEYANILNGYPDYPLVYYARAHLYGMLGRTVEASFDTERVRQYTEGEPELTGLAAALTAAYPLDTSRLEDWLYYPILTTYVNPGGVQVVDQTQVPSNPIQLAAYDDLESMFGLGLERSLIPTPIYPIRADVMRLTRLESSYRYSWRGLEVGEDINLTPQGNIFVGSREYWEGEGISQREFLLAPAGEPDPRIYLHGERCSGGIISRLRSGEQVGPRWFISLPLFDTPGGVEIHTTDTPVTILPEMECQAGIMWWQAITPDGIVGWVQENDGDEYHLNPYNANRAAQIPFYCPDVPQIRLIVGGTGTVLPGMGVNNVRADPNTNAPVVASIPAEDTFAVTNGPVCADGFAWWEVDYEGTQGWTAEGEGDTYWLAPVLDLENSGAGG